MPFLFSLAGILQPRAGSRFRAHALLLLRPLFPQHAPYRAACLARQTCLLVPAPPRAAPPLALPACAARFCAAGVPPGGFPKPCPLRPP